MCMPQMEMEKLPRRPTRPFRTNTQKRCPFHYRVLECQETPGVTGKFGLGIRNEAGQRLIEFCQENALVITNTLFQQHVKKFIHHGQFAFIPTVQEELRGATPCPRSGGCVGTGGSRGATPRSRSGGVAERRNTSSKVRSSDCTLLEQPWRDIPCPREEIPK